MNTLHTPPFVPALFLDIDDVLCLNDVYGGFDVMDAVNGMHEDPDDVFARVFHGPACEALKRVHAALDGRLRYVISSTWRGAMTRPQLHEVFQRTGLDFVASALHPAWSTPQSALPGQRVDDIAAWMDHWHAGEPFAILDDTFSGPTLQPVLANPLHPFHGRVVLCQERVGLLDEHVEPLVAMLKRPLGR